VTIVESRGYSGLYEIYTQGTEHQGGSAESDNSNAPCGMSLSFEEWEEAGMGCSNTTDSQISREDVDDSYLTASRGKAV
jgi:hypothetical protein